METTNGALQHLITAASYTGLVVIDEDVLHCMLKAAELAEKPVTVRHRNAHAARAVTAVDSEVRRMIYSLTTKERYRMRLRIREIRLQRGMTLKELGDKVGRKPHSVWEYEQHKTRVPASVLYEITKALGVSMSEICVDDVVAPTTEQETTHV